MTFATLTRSAATLALTLLMSATCVIGAVAPGQPVAATTRMAA
jgi:hypothetical protein